MIDGCNVAGRSRQPRREDPLHAQRWSVIAMMLEALNKCPFVKIPCALSDVGWFRSCRAFSALTAWEDPLQAQRRSRLPILQDALSNPLVKILYAFSVGQCFRSCRALSATVCSRRSCSSSAMLDGSDVAGRSRPGLVRMLCASNDGRWIRCCRTLSATPREDPLRIQRWSMVSILPDVLGN